MVMVPLMLISAALHSVGWHMLHSLSSLFWFGFTAALVISAAGERPPPFPVEVFD